MMSDVVGTPAYLFEDVLNCVSHLSSTHVYNLESPGIFRESAISELHRFELRYFIPVHNG
jgi:hypothetical protein